MQNPLGVLVAKLVSLLLSLFTLFPFFKLQFTFSFGSEEYITLNFWGESIKNNFEFRLVWILAFFKLYLLSFCVVELAWEANHLTSGAKLKLKYLGQFPRKKLESSLSQSPPTRHQPNLSSAFPIYQFYFPSIDKRTLDIPKNTRVRFTNF